MSIRGQNGGLVWHNKHKDTKTNAVHKSHTEERVESSLTFEGCLTLQLSETSK